MVVCWNLEQVSGKMFWVHPHSSCRQHWARSPHTHTHTHTFLKFCVQCPIQSLINAKWQWQASTFLVQLFVNILQVIHCPLAMLVVVKGYWLSSWKLLHLLTVSMAMRTTFSGCDSQHGSQDTHVSRSRWAECNSWRPMALKGFLKVSEFQLVLAKHATFAASAEHEMFCFGQRSSRRKCEKFVFTRSIFISLK